MRARRIYINIVGSAIGSLSGLIAMMLVARFSGSEVLGIIGFGLAYINTFGVVITLDLESAHLKILPSKQTEEEKGRAIGAYAFLKFTMVILALAGVLLAIQLGLSDTVNADKEIYLPVLVILFIFTALFRTSYIPVISFAALGMTAKQQISTTLGTFTRNLLLAIIGTLALGTIALSMAYVAGAIMMLASALLMFKGFSFGRPTRAGIKEYLSIGGPLMAAPIFTTGITSVDKLVLDAFWGASDVGVYFLAQSIAVSLLFLGASLRFVFIPGFSEDLRAGRTDSIEEQSRRITKLVPMAFLPVSAFAIFFGETYSIYLFGDSFEIVGMLLGILIIGTMFSLLTDPLKSLTVAEGRTKHVVFATMLAFATCATSLVILVPESIAGFDAAGLASLGCAISFTLAFFVQMMYYRIVTSRFKDYFSRKSTILTLIVVVACVTIFIPIASIVDSYSGIVSMMVILPSFFATYVVLALATGALTRKDISFILKATSLRKAVEYINDEISK